MSRELVSYEVTYRSHWIGNHLKCIRRTERTRSLQTSSLTFSILARFPLSRSSASGSVFFCFKSCDTLRLQWVGVIMRWIGRWHPTLKFHLVPAWFKFWVRMYSEIAHKWERVARAGWQRVWLNQSRNSVIPLFASSWQRTYFLARSWAVTKLAPLNLQSWAMMVGRTIHLWLDNDKRRRLNVIFRNEDN